MNFTKEQGDTDKVDIKAERIVVITHPDDLMYLDYEAVYKSKQPVLIVPNIDTETIHARLREAKFFGVLEYNPEKMSHKILKVMNPLILFDDSDFKVEEESKKEEKSHSTIDDFLKNN